MSMKKFWVIATSLNNEFVFANRHIYTDCDSQTPLLTFSLAYTIIITKVISLNKLCMQHWIILMQWNFEKY